MGGELGQVARGLPAPADASDRFFADLLAGFLHHMDGEVAAGADLLATAVADAERTGDPTLAIPAHQAFYVGDDAAALRLNARAVARARATGAVADLLFALPRLVQAEVLAGQWTAATAGAAEAVQLAEEVGREELAALPLAWLMLIAALRGDDQAFGRLPDVWSASVLRTPSASSARRRRRSPGGPGRYRRRRPDDPRRRSPCSTT